MVSKFTRNTLATLTAACALVLGASAVQAAVVTFDYNYAFSGSAPASAAPWLRATFDDHGTTGNVSLTVTANGLVPGEFLSQLYLNLNPSLNATSLVFSYQGSSTAPAASVSTGTNAYKADGDGYYDILLNFPPPPGTQKFDAGEQAVYTITGIASLSANSFYALSAPGSGSNAGPFYSAAHVQGLSGGGSSWLAPVAVPLPMAVWLFAPAAMGLFGFTRRKK